MRVETSLLIMGHGPAAVVAAKVAGACGQPCLLVGHEITGGDAPVELDDTALAVLEDHGLIDVLRPHLAGSERMSVVPSEFEHVLKHHCVADLNVVVYDRFEVVDRAVRDGTLAGVLSDGRTGWPLVADTWIDADLLTGTLPAAIVEGAAAARRAIERLPAMRRMGQRTGQ
jgi:hypothetical protein